LSGMLICEGSSMSLRLGWKALLAIACCVAIPGCAPFRHGNASKAVPAASAQGRSNAPDALDAILAEPEPQSPKATGGVSSLFRGESKKKGAARQAEIESELAIARLGERRGQEAN